MSNNLILLINNIAYDEERNISTIEGRGINTITKNPLKVTADIPIYLNTIEKPDINHEFGIDRDMNYGFLIQIDGDFKKLKPNFTFTADDETINKSVFDLKVTHDVNKVRRFFETLDEYDLPTAKFMLRNKKKPKSKSLKDLIREKPQPDDPFLPWMQSEEKEIAHQLNPFQIDHTPSYSVIITAKNNNLEETLKSAEEQTVKPEIIIASTTPIESEYPVVVKESITKAVEEAIKQAQGEYITFLDEGDLLDSNFSQELGYYLKENLDPDFIYGDSDSIDDNNNRYDVKFKPELDKIFLNQTNYILNPIIFKKDYLESLLPLEETDLLLQKYGLILKAVETENWLHIPRVLYHWRKHLDDVMANQKDVEDYEKITELLGEKQAVRQSEIDYAFDFLEDQTGQSVSIITGVLTGEDDKQIIEDIEFILKNTDYENFIIYAVNINTFTDDKRVVYLKDDEAKTRAQLYNRAAEQALEDYLLFIAPSFKMVEPIWIKEMVKLASLEGVGIVGPKFFNDLYRIEEAGVTVKDNKRYPIEADRHILTTGYNYDLRIPHEVFAVNGDCLLIKRSLFDEIGGFDKNLSPNTYDIDLAIKARDKGYKTVVAANTPVIFKYRDKVDDDISELNTIYPKEKLTEFLINENIQPGTMVHKLIRED